MAKALQHEKIEATPHPPQNLSQSEKWEFPSNSNLWTSINLMSKKSGFRLRNFNTTLKHVCHFCIPIAACSWSLMLQGKAKHLHELWKAYNCDLDSERKNPFPTYLQTVSYLTLSWKRLGWNKSKTEKSHSQCKKGGEYGFTHSLACHRLASLQAAMTKHVFFKVCSPVLIVQH